MQEPNMSPMPIILKHPILARIDEISRDCAKVGALRDLLILECSAGALADVAVRHGICTRELADHMLRYWANVDGAGWLGEIMSELRLRVLEVCELLLAGGPPLSSWWILGLGERFRIALSPTEEQLLLFMTTPPFPRIIGASKMPIHSLDPFFRPLIEQLRDQLNEMLALEP